MKTISKTNSSKTDMVLTLINKNEIVTLEPKHHSLSNFMKNTRLFILDRCPTLLQGKPGIERLTVIKNKGFSMG